MMYTCLYLYIDTLLQKKLIKHCLIKITNCIKSFKLAPTQQSDATYIVKYSSQGGSEGASLERRGSLHPRRKSKF